MAIKKGSIYLARCLINGKCYVGQTIKENPEDRINQHLQTKTNNMFHRAIRKYKPENFVWCWIRYKDVPEWLLNDLERFFIALYKTQEIGYNMTPGGNFNPMSDPEICMRHKESIFKHSILLNGNKMKEWRENQCISINFICEKVDIAYESIQGWEIEEIGITQKSRLKWFNVFGFDPVDRFQ